MSRLRPQGLGPRNTVTTVVSRSRPTTETFPSYGCPNGLDVALGLPPGRSHRSDDTSSHYYVTRARPNYTYKSTNLTKVTISNTLNFFLCVFRLLCLERKTFRLSTTSPPVVLFPRVGRVGEGKV